MSMEQFQTKTWQSQKKNNTGKTSKNSHGTSTAAHNTQDRFSLSSPPKGWAPAPLLVLLLPDYQRTSTTTQVLHTNTLQSAEQPSSKESYRHKWRPPPSFYFDRVQRHSEPLLACGRVARPCSHLIRRSATSRALLLLLLPTTGTVAASRLLVSRCSWPLCVERAESWVVSERPRKRGWSSCCRSSSPAPFCSLPWVLLVMPLFALVLWISCVVSLRLIVLLL
jgi:hypothetical protein